MSSGLRVLQVMEAALGGTRRYLEDVAEALGQGDQYGLVYSLHRADGAFMVLLEKLRRARWNLYELDMRREIMPLHDLRSVSRLQRIYRDFRPDVVHAHSSKGGALARLATLVMKDRPGLVYTPNSIASNVSRIYGLIEKLLALRLDVIAAVTESERVELSGLKLLPLDRIHVVVPTIPFDRFAPRTRETARMELGLGKGPLMIAIGRLTHQKDPISFVEIAAAVRRRVPSVRAVWVGDGELRGAVEERIAALNLQDAISITGWLEDVRPYIAAADLFVSTSRYESFGYVTAEALAMERPVVASKITGTVDVVKHDVEHQLFTPFDVDAATKRAAFLLSDPLLAAAIARRGRAFVNAEFSVEATRRGLAVAYNAARRGGS